MAGRRNPVVCLDDFEEFAAQTLPKTTFEHIKEGAGEGITCSANKKAFSRYKLLPRLLRDVSNLDLRTTILGHRVDFPVGIAPSSMHKLSHPDGEVATVGAARALNTVYTMSTYATCTMEDITDVAPNCLKFLQLYTPSNKGRPFVEDLVRRAERCGFAAIVVTVDAPVLGTRYADMRNRFNIPAHIELKNAEKSCRNAGLKVDLHNFSSLLIDPSLTWVDVKWLKSFTSLPVIIKGILSAADAVLAVDSGASAVWVSNHGGRHLDSTPATIDVLSSIVSAVKGRCEVYVDGGIRRGTDVLKALALGANMVFIGRPVLYGLVYDGENGVKEVLRLLKTELSTAMALSGCRSLSEINRQLLVDERTLAKL